MKDLESNDTPLLGTEVKPTPKSETKARRSSAVAWIWLFAASLSCFVASYILCASSETTVQLLSSSNAITSSAVTTGVSKWHIKPIHPRHHGRVVYLTESTSDGIKYKRVFTVPCGDGMLVFNVGPAAEYEPFAYDVYEDAYAYSDNKGLCILYPTYEGVQTADRPLWNEHDLTDQTVGLGDTPTKISTRVVKMPNSKDIDPKRGGDFVIMKGGNFYNPNYYKHLKSEINRWPGNVNVQEKLAELVEQMETMSLLE